MARSTDITSVSEHRSKLKSHLEQINSTGRPLFVTSEGKTVAVVLSPSAYDALADASELADAQQMVKASLADIAAGRTQPAKAAIESVAGELGLSLKRQTSRRSQAHD